MFFKTYRYKLKAFSHYMGTWDEPRTIIGLAGDFLFPVSGLFAILYIWLIFRTRSSLLSLGIDLTVSSLFAYALFLRKKTTYRENRRRLRKEIAREYMASRLSQLSRQEFEWQIVKALSSIKEIKDVEQKQGYLKAQYKDTPIAIGYYHAPLQGYETYERVWAFYNSFTSKGYKKLIYISSGYFEDASKNILNGDFQVPISLLNIENLLDLMENAGMAPKDEFLDHLINQKIVGFKKRKDKGKKSAPGHRVKNYMLSSLMFLGISLFFRKYFLFYFVLSILFFILALISQILFGRWEKYNSKTPQ